MKYIQDVIAEAMQESLENAERVERENRDSGTPISRAFDAGRVIGMTDMIRHVFNYVKSDPPVCRPRHCTNETKEVGR